MKKLLCLLLILAMLFAMLPGALAEEIRIVEPEQLPPGDEPASGVCGNGVSWSLNGDGRLTVYGTGRMDDFGYSSNRAPWYEYRDQIKSVLVRATVSHIGSYAFHGCNKLTYAQISKYTLSWGEGAFYECAALEEVDFLDGEGYDVGSVEDRPAANRAAANDADTTLGKYCFLNCTALREARISHEISAIGEQAFSGCSSLEGFNVSAWDNNELDSIGYGAFENCTSLKYFEINARTIGAYAFYNCSSLKYLNLYRCTETIGSSAFQNCTALESVNIPDHVTSVGSFAFSGCSGVRSIDVGGAVQSLGGYCFADCSALQEVNFFGFVPSFGNQSFGNVRAYAWYFQSELDWTSAALQNYGGVLTWKPFYTGGGSYAWKATKDGLLRIMGSGCVEEGCGFNRLGAWIKKVEIGEGITALGRNFEYMDLLTEVSLPQSLEYIDFSCFYICPAMEHITIPAKVNHIGSFAFAYCDALKTVRFEGGAPEEVGTWVFDYVTATAYYPAGDPSWTDEAREQFSGDLTWVPYSDASVPEISSVAMDTDGLHLAWMPVSDASEYEVRFGPADESYYRYDIVTGTSCTFSNVKMGEAGYCRVRSYVNGKVSDWGTPVAATFNPFADVSGKKTLEYVGWAYNNGIVKGTGKTTFSPDDPCSRIQFVMMLWKMNDSPEVSGKNHFSDISGAKTTKAILWALKEGVINSGSKFYPDETISRVQIVMILWKLAGSPEVSGKCPFQDVSGAKTTKAVLWAYKNGITKGTSDTAFSPDKPCTRVQLVVFLYKYNEIYRIVS